MNKNETSRKGESDLGGRAGPQNTPMPSSVAAENGEDSLPTISFHTSYNIWAHA
jgi:hypothetical protein